MTDGEQTKSGWREFFSDSRRPSEDFMMERIDLPPQARELFKS